MTPLEQQVLKAAVTGGRGVQVRELARMAGGGIAEVLDALCTLEEQGLVTPWSWAPTDDGKEAVR